MPEFITTDDGGWVFKLDSEPEVPNLPVHDPFQRQDVMIASYLDDPDKWKNYSDDVLFELETLLREFMKQKLDDPDWKKTKYRRYTCGLMFEQLYGRTASQRNHDDAVRMRRLPKLMAYYSTRVQKEAYIRGKRYVKSVYTLSLDRYRRKPPYSLKIRIKWLAEQGKTPTWHNMMLPKDDLKAGHARNPKTEENMRIRREHAKKLYNERYKDRDH